MWLVLGNTTRHRHVSKLRLLTVFPPKQFSCTRLECCFPATVMWKHMCSYTCGPQSQRLASPARSHEPISLGQEHCSVKPAPFHPKAEAATVLTHMFVRNRGVDKHAAMHPPQTSTQFRHSVTRPSHMFDKFDVTVSPAQWSFAFAHDGGTHNGNASQAR